jgi:hypothetical protein
MYRELISWLGLFTSQKETLTFISKRVTSNQLQAQGSGASMTQGDKHSA